MSGLRPNHPVLPNHPRANESGCDVVSFLKQPQTVTDRGSRGDEERVPGRKWKQFLSTVSPDSLQINLQWVESKSQNFERIWWKINKSKEWMEKRGRKKWKESAGDCDFNESHIKPPIRHLVKGQKELRQTGFRWRTKRGNKDSTLTSPLIPLSDHWQDRKGSPQQLCAGFREQLLLYQWISVPWITSS